MEDGIMVLKFLALFSDETKVVIESQQNYKRHYEGNVGEYFKLVTRPQWWKEIETVSAIDDEVVVRIWE